MSRSRNQTITTNPDAATQRYAEQVRRFAEGTYQNAMGLTGQGGVAGLTPDELRARMLAGNMAGGLPDQTIGLQTVADQSAQGRGVMAMLGGQTQAGTVPLQGVASLTGDAAALMAQQAQQGQQAGAMVQAQGQMGGGILGMLAGQSPAVQQMLMQQAAQGGGLTADMAARYGTGADTLTGAAGALPMAQAQQQAAAMGLLSPGIAAQQAAVTGGPNTAAFFNPYQEQVIGATRDAFDSARNRLNRNLSDRATQAGAFGGSREAVARGQALADLARDETQQISALLNSGYMDAMNRAQADQQFRFGAGSQMAGTGLGVLDALAGRGISAGGSLFGAGAQAQAAGQNALGQLFAGGQNAAGQLFGGGLNAALAQQQIGANATGQLFGAGQNAAQFLAGLGAQNANALANMGFSAQNTLFNAGMNGIGLLGQFGGIERVINQARINDPLDRQLQALGALGIGFGAQGQVQNIPQTRNMAAGILGGASSGASIGGAVGGPPGALIGGLIGGGLGAVG